MAFNERESKIFWPLVLFPFAIDNAHTRSYTGRCWIKDIKAFFSFADIILTDTKLICRYRILRLLIFDVSLDDKSYKFTNKTILVNPISLVEFHLTNSGHLERISKIT